jgi:hypothetical protein
MCPNLSRSRGGYLEAHVSRELSGEWKIQVISVRTRPYPAPEDGTAGADEARSRTTFVLLYSPRSDDHRSNRGLIHIYAYTLQTADLATTAEKSF